MAADHYATLGLRRGASPAEIKRAYRRLARQLHPDVTGDDPRSTERFKRITEAYEVLSDPAKRRSYDLFGDRNAQPEDASPFAPVSEIFDELRRRADRTVRKEPGVDLEHPVTIPFAAALTGADEQITVEVVQRCATCSGLGYPADKPPERCAACSGTGNRSTFPFPRACTTCDGAGTVRRFSCKACAGEGRRTERLVLTVHVPAGVDDGTRLRLRGKGHAGANGGEPGDLYVVLHVAADPRFVREGTTIKTEVRVGLREALCGGKVDVVLADGEARMTIPAGTQGGQVFRVRGRGFPNMTQKGGPSVRGDVLVTVQLRVPQHVSAADLDDLRRILARIEPDGGAA